MLDRGAGRKSSVFSCVRACMCIFRGNSRPFRCSAMLLKGSETGFAWYFSFFFGSSTSSIFIFRDNSRAFRWSWMVLNGVFIIHLVLFRPFESSTSWMFIFGGNSRTFCCSGMVLNGVFNGFHNKTRTSSYGPRTSLCDVHEL